MEAQSRIESHHGPHLRPILCCCRGATGREGGAGGGFPKVEGGGLGPSPVAEGGGSPCAATALAPAKKARLAWRRDGPFLIPAPRRQREAPFLRREAAPGLARNFDLPSSPTTASRPHTSWVDKRLLHVRSDGFVIVFLYLAGRRRSGPRFLNWIGTCPIGESLQGFPQFVADTSSSTGEKLVKCSISDLSRTGAKLVVPSTMSIPHKFDLLFENSQMVYGLNSKIERNMVLRASLVEWTKGDEIGVSFSGIGSAPTASVGAGGNATDRRAGRANPRCGDVGGAGDGCGRKNWQSTAS